MAKICQTYPELRLLSSLISGAKLINIEKTAYYQKFKKEDNGLKGNYIKKERTSKSPLLLFLFYSSFGS